MPSTVNSSIMSCYGKSKHNNSFSASSENRIFKTKVDLLNCKPEDVNLRMEGNRVIIEGKLFKGKKDKPVYFSKHYIMPENCNMNEMQYTITPDGVYITAPRKEKVSDEWPKLEDSCITNCVDLGDRFEIRLNVQGFRPEDIKIKVNGNTISIKAKHLQETGMKKVIKTYSLPENCEITKLERKFMPEGHLLLTIPKFLGLFLDTTNSKTSKKEENKNIKCKFNISAEAFEIKIDVSNYNPGDINIIQQKRMITVEGKRFRKSEHLEERFEKTFVLPSEYDITKIDRKFHSDGVLVISVPRIKGKPLQNFKTFLPENSICNMKVEEDHVEIRLNIVGFSPEEITIRVTGKNTITIDGKQTNHLGKINKSFMKSYMLPTDCDTKKIKKHLTADGFLIVKIMRCRRSCSLENLTDNEDDEEIFSNRKTNGSLDNLSETNENIMINSAELDKRKFEMKFNVQGFETENIYVKINKNIITVECRHPQPGRGLIKSYLIPKEYDLSALQTLITHDDILIVTIPKFPNSTTSNHINTDQTSRETNSKNENNYIVKVDIRGYRSDDISLDTDGQKIIVQGGHLGNRDISKSFSKTFSIPHEYDVKRMNSYISANGMLIIDIPKRTSEENNNVPKLYSFPRENSIEESLRKSTKNSMSMHQKKRIVPEMKRPNSCDELESHQDIVSDEEPQKDYNKITEFPEDKIITNNELEGMSNGNNLSGSLKFDDLGNEFFQLDIDIKNHRERDIDIKIKGHNLRVETKNNPEEAKTSTKNFVKNFIVPEVFNMKGIKTKIQGGSLLVRIPKKKTESQSEVRTRKKDLLNNIKIGQESIDVEIDANDLKIEDFELSTNKNILTIEILKSKHEDDKFKTNIHLPDNVIIDDISKRVTCDGKLVVSIPRKPVSNFTNSEDQNEKMIFTEDKQVMLRKATSVLEISNMEKKPKSVKFLIERENSSDSKFATLPRYVNSKSYNSLNLEDVPSSEAPVDGCSNQDFELKLLTPHHEPNEISVKIRGTTITIEGKKENGKENSYFSKNFFKTYTVPSDIDVSKLKSEFVEDYLIISAPRHIISGETENNVQS